MTATRNALPSVPVQHQEFVEYVNSHQDTPIEELVCPYNEYDAVVRKVFAQEPSNPALRDNHVNLVPVYDSTGSTNVPIRARNLTAETPETKEKYLLPLKDQDRRPNGSPAVVPTLEEFQKNFSVFSEGALSDMDWSNVVVAGSAVVTSLLPVPEKYRGSKRALRQLYHEKSAPASDVDLFLYGLSEEQAIEKIRQIESKIKNTILYETTAVRTKNTITIASQYPNRHVQIVLRIYKSISEILTGFDVDCSCAAYDGKQLYVAPRALAAYITQINRIDLTRRSPSYENRLSKYSHRGFEVFWPPLERSRIDPTIFERSFSRTVGLARLLVLEKLPKTDDRESYVIQRRVERGRPVDVFARRIRQLPGNIKNDWEDEVPEWQEDDEISDYNTFSIPYGRGYYAKKIERIVFTKDLILNAEWNRQKERTVGLHRHPAFFGDVDDVIRDCCGCCPKPTTQEEKEVAEEESKTYISGDVSFIKDDPGRQEIGSFNPVTDTDWTEMAYVGNTEQLCQAIVDYDLAAVKAWLSQEGADPNSRDYTGRTPLHLASLTSTPEIVQCLVDHGARLISRLADGRTALHIAAARGSVEIIRILLTKSEQNEEQESKKDDLRKGTSGQEKRRNTGASEAGDSDIDVIDSGEADDASSRTSGSFVKVEPESGGDDVFDNVPQNENELEPDIYDINVIAWDSHTSALHLAILGGHVDVVEELVSSFGADVLLPVKLTGDNSEPDAAILTLVLALQLPLERASAMTQKLLQLGASPAQADLKRNTPLHYLAVSKHIELLDVYTHHDEPAVKRAINYLAFSGSAWDLEPYSAFVAALNAKNVIGAIKMLDAGASPSLEFSHVMKSAKTVYERIQENSSEENKNIFRQAISQPIILGVRKDLPDVIIDLIVNRGVDPNTLTPDGYHVVDEEDIRDGLKGESLLDCIQEKIKGLRAYKGEKADSTPPRPLDPDDNYYLAGIPDGTYAMWYAQQQVKEARNQYENALKEHEKAVNEAKNRPGVDRKFAAVNELIQKFEKLEAILREKGGKNFAELYPDIEGPQENNDPEDEGDDLRKDRFKVVLSFKVPDLTDTKRDGYLKLFNAAWHGDLTTIKTLTLGVWGPKEDELPLQIAVSDRYGMSPFSIAAIQGHLDVAKAIIEIVQIQYKPKEQRGQRRYVMEGEDGDDPEALQGDDEIQIYSELIDDQFTIENIGEVATQVECPITPLQVFSWECAARLFTEQDGLSKGERVAIQSKVEYISEGGRRMYWFPFSEPALRAPQNLVEYAVWTDNISLLVFLLELGQDLTNRQAEADSPIYTVPEQAFQLAIILCRLHCLEVLIQRTGAGLPIDELLKKSGVKTDDKPKLYPGLTIRGKKRKEWAMLQPWAQRQTHENTPPLLAAAFYGKLESVKWFLSKSPAEQYLAFAKTYEHDRRFKHLAESAGGVERAIKNWLGSRSGLVLHCAVMSQTPTPESEELVKYLAEQYPACLETKSEEGYTPLALAFSLHRPSFAKILINAGADQAVRDRHGSNILHLLLCDIEDRACENTENLQPLLSLLDSRLVPTLLTGRSSKMPGSLTPLHLWMERAYRFGTYTSQRTRGQNIGSQETDDKVAVAQLILDFAQSTGQKHLELLNRAGNTLVHDATKGGLPRTLDLMLSRRPDLLHRESATGTTPLEMAVDAWINEAASSPPVIPRERPSWSQAGRPEHVSILDMDPEYFVRDLSTQHDYDFDYDVPQVVYNLCREHAQKGAGEKRKLVSLFEANEVAKRLAASHSDDHSNADEQLKEDEVTRWYMHASNS